MKVYFWNSQLVISFYNFILRDPKQVLCNIGAIISIYFFFIYNGFKHAILLFPEIIVWNTSISLDSNLSQLYLLIGKMWHSFRRLTFLVQKIQASKIPIPTSHKMKEGAWYQVHWRERCQIQKNPSANWDKEESQQELPRSCSYQISFSSAVPGLWSFSSRASTGTLPLSWVRN